MSRSDSCHFIPYICMLLTLSSALSAHVLRIDDHVHVYTVEWNLDRLLFSQGVNQGTTLTSYEEYVKSKEPI